MSAVRHVRIGALSATLAAAALLAAAAPSVAAPEDYGLETVTAEFASDQAGAHGDLTFAVDFKLDPDFEGSDQYPVSAHAATRNIRFGLPAGLAGNPTLVAEQCTAAELLSSLDPDDVRCPNGSQVGLTNIYGVGNGPFNEPVYMMVPPGGDVVARFGLIAGVYPVFVDVKVRAERDYGLVAEVTDAPPRTNLIRVETTTWGVPADPAHDTERCTPNEIFEHGCTSSPPRPPGAVPRAFLINPTRCGTPLELAVSASSWVYPDIFDTLAGTIEPVTGCDRLDFSPELALVPTSRRADWSAGMDVALSLPQETIGEPGGLAEAHLDKTVVTLPEGLSLNAAAADGLAACTTAQIGLISKDPIRFNSADPTCPEASKVGTAEITTPVLEDRLEGSLYVADQHDNPFDTLLSGYLVVQGQGVTIKLAGRFDPDPNTGRLTATFDNNPQLPFSLADLHFKGGSRGVVATPPGCGRFAVQSVLTSWAAPERPVVRDGAFLFDQGCGRPFAFDFAAGTANPRAGAASPFGMNVARASGTQVFKGVTLTLPPGLLATLRGIPQCPEAQATAGSCSEASKVGTVSASAGAGETPMWIPQPGKTPTRVYLAGPYKGAPFSLSVVVPAQAGPFDLGEVVVRVALFVDPSDGHVTAVSDPLPHILRGILLNVREMRVAVDRPGFTRNPTSCAPLAVDGVFNSLEGSTRAAASHFQVGDCARLRFKPRFRIRLTGKKQTRDGGHPGLIATATQRPGEAGIKQVKVALPLSLALDPDNAQALCEYEDGLRLDCPASSIIGQATAVTPLLNEPLRGPVYFVKNVRISPRTGRRIRTLPTLLVTLTGENGVKINLRASSDVDKKARLVSTFANLPDAPVSQFKMNLEGGKDGILVVTKKDVCRGKHIALAQTDGHNGKHHDPKIRLKTPCRKPKRARCNTSKQKRSRACKRRAQTTRPR